MHFDGRYAGMRDADAQAEAAVAEAASGGGGAAGRKDMAEGPRQGDAAERAEGTKHAEAAKPGPAAAPPPGPLTASSRWRRDRDIPETLRLRAIEAILPEGEIEGDVG